MSDKFLNKSSKPVRNRFPSVCRACMSPSKNMKCVFSAEATRIIEELEFCTTILITKDDGLPTKLCELCLATLAIAHKFKTDCLRADDIFRNVIRKPKIPDAVIKIEKEEVIEVAESDFEYQELEPKQEVDSDGDFCNNDDELLCVIAKQKTRTRLKNNTKKKIGRGTIKRQTIGKKYPRGKTDGAKLRRKISKGALNKEKSYSCHLCDMRFDSVTEQMEHKKIQHGNCEWICEICGKTFKHRSSHYSHVRSHLPPTHQCGQCDYTTWHKADLAKHQRTHSGIKDFVCEYCTKGFYNSSNLRGHIRRNHGIVEKKYPCPRCDRAFYAADKLRRHLDTHDNIKRFKCEVCNDRFSRRCQWKNHLTKVHNISIPRIRPGRRKLNVVIGVKDPPIDSANLINIPEQNS